MEDDGEQILGLIKEYVYDFGADSFYMMMDNWYNPDDMKGFVIYIMMVVYFDVWYSEWGSKVEKSHKRISTVYKKLQDVDNLNFKDKILLSDRLINTAHTTGSMSDHYEEHGEYIETYMLDELANDSKYADEWDEEIVGTVI